MTENLESSDETVQRWSSILSRVVRDGRPVFVKNYLQGEWGRDSDVIKARTAREAQLMETCRKSSLFLGRLGIPNVISADPAKATIVTAEIPGAPLEQLLLLKSSNRRERLLALFLAGRWLQLLQSISVNADDRQRIGNHDPEDLLEYCELRLQELVKLGFSWPSASQRHDVQHMLRRLVDEAGSDDHRFLWCHGDFGPGNILWDGSRLTAIDFETAHPERPLVDVTYFIHRMEMLQIYFPWRRWPVAAWTRAFLRGYGRPDAAESPMYRALMIRQFLCRLQTYVRRPPKNLKQRLHNPWVRRCVIRELQKRIEC